MGLIQSLPVPSGIPFFSWTINRFLSWAPSLQLRKTGSNSPSWKRKEYSNSFAFSSKYFSSLLLFITKLCQKMLMLTSPPPSALIYSSVHNSLAPALAMLPKSSRMIISFVQNPMVSFQSSSSLASLLTTLFPHFKKLSFIHHFLWFRNCAKCFI